MAEERTASVATVSTRNQVIKSEVKSSTQPTTVIQTASNKETAAASKPKTKKETRKISLNAVSKENTVAQITPDSSSNNGSPMKTETHVYVLYSISSLLNIKY